MLGLHPASGESFWNDTGSVAVIDQRRSSLVLTGWNVRPM
jgi:hypothetical protein